jgi:hypothetical protein
MTPTLTETKSQIWQSKDTVTGPCQSLTTPVSQYVFLQELFKTAAQPPSTCEDAFPYKFTDYFLLLFTSQRRATHSAHLILLHGINLTF